MADTAKEDEEVGDGEANALAGTKSVDMAASDQKISSNDDDDDDADVEEESFVEEPAGNNNGSWWDITATVSSGLDSVIPNTVTSLFQAGTPATKPADVDEESDLVDHSDGNSDDDSVDPLEDAKRTAAELSKSAQVNLAIVGSEIATGWGALNTFVDGVLERPETFGQRTVKAGSEEGVQAEFATCFPELAGQEDVVDVFSCSLLQKYRCFHNGATPERTFDIAGRLFVTVDHCTFYAQNDSLGQNKPLSVITPFAKVDKIQKGQSKALRVVLKGQSYYIFSRFQSEADFSGVLGLLEHMSAEKSSPSAAPAPAPAPASTASAPDDDPQAKPARTPEKTVESVPPVSTT